MSDPATNIAAIGTTSTCGNCRYWDHKKDSRYGRCRINPPHLLHTTDTGVWPATRVDDFCFAHWLIGS